MGQERDLVVQIREIRTKLEGGEPGDGAGPSGAAEEMDNPRMAAARCRRAFRFLPPWLSRFRRNCALNSPILRVNSRTWAGEARLVRVCVDAQMVGEVISAWTGIPVGKMMRDEVAPVSSLGDKLGNRVIGQEPRAGGHSASGSDVAGQPG